MRGLVLLPRKTARYVSFVLMLISFLCALRVEAEARYSGAGDRRWRRRPWRPLALARMKAPCRTAWVCGRAAAEVRQRAAAISGSVRINAPTAFPRSHARRPARKTASNGRCYEHGPFRYVLSRGGPNPSTPFVTAMITLALLGLAALGASPRRSSPARSRPRKP